MGDFQNIESLFLFGFQGVQKLKLLILKVL
jgi:hypothetical protein